MRGEAVADADIAREIAPCFVERDGRRTDTVVLACTHFPWLREEMAALSPPETAWIDSGEAVARRVRTLLEEAGMNTASDDAAPTAARRVFFTARDDAIDSRLAAFRRFGYSETAFVAV